MSGHVYPAIHAAGNASLHLGDVHYHGTAPMSARDQLLSSLHFPEMFVRYEIIDEPHNNTFEWIFELPNEKQQPWHSFSDWLLGENPIYWVSGKSGSGKSALMKHLSDITAAFLSKTGQSRLIFSYWFWEAAHNPLQRDLTGCIRSLLW